MGVVREGRCEFPIFFHGAGVAVYPRRARGNSGLKAAGLEMAAARPRCPRLMAWLPRRPCRWVAARPHGPRLQPVCEWSTQQPPRPLLPRVATMAPGHAHNTPTPSVPFVQEFSPACAQAPPRRRAVLATQDGPLLGQNPSDSSQCRAALAPHCMRAAARCRLHAMEPSFLCLPACLYPGPGPTGSGGESADWTGHPVRRIDSDLFPVRPWIRNPAMTNVNMHSAHAAPLSQALGRVGSSRVPTRGIPPHSANRPMPAVVPCNQGMHARQ